MMLKMSSVKKTPINLFLQTIKKNLGIIILFLIFMLFICPGFLINQLRDDLGYEVLGEIGSASRMFMGTSSVIIVITTLMSAVFCFINFGFLYSKKSVDLYFSLPIKRTSLILIRFLSSVAPVILTSAICYSLMGIVLIKYDIFWQFSHILLSFGLNVISILGFCSLLMVFICCAGTIADLFISFFGLNIAVMVIVEIFRDYCGRHLYGYRYGTYIDTEKINPFIRFVLAPCQILEQLDEITVKKEILEFCIYSLIFIVISVVTSLILFKKRRVEKCVCAYAFKGMYYICSVVVGFIGGYLAGMIFSDGNSNLSFWIFSVFGSLIATVTFGLVSNRSLKKIKSSLILGGISYIATVLIIVVISSGGLGFAKRVPLESKVSSAYLVGDYSLETDDTNLIISIHKNIISHEPSIIESLKGMDSSNINSTYININYELKNGGNINRHYYVDKNLVKSEIAKIYKSNSFITNVKEKFENITGDNIYISSDDFIKYFSDENRKENEYTSTISSVKITKDILTSLQKAYIKDIMELSPDELTKENMDRLLSVEARNENMKFVEIHYNDNFKNTKTVVGEIAKLIK